MQRYSALRSRQAQKQRKRQAVLAVYLFEDSVMSNVSFHGNGLEVSGGTLMNVHVDSPRRHNTALGWALVRAASILT